MSGRGRRSSVLVTSSPAKKQEEYESASTGRGPQLVDPDETPGSAPARPSVRNLSSSLGAHHTLAADSGQGASSSGARPGVRPTVTVALDQPGPSAAISRQPQAAYAAPAFLGFRERRDAAGSSPGKNDSGLGNLSLAESEEPHSMTEHDFDQDLEQEWDSRDHLGGLLSAQNIQEPRFLQVPSSTWQPQNPASSSSGQQQLGEIGLASSSHSYPQLQVDLSLRKVSGTSPRHSTTHSPALSPISFASDQEEVTSDPSENLHGVASVGQSPTEDDLTNVSSLSSDPEDQPMVPTAAAEGDTTDRRSVRGQSHQSRVTSNPSASKSQAGESDVMEMESYSHREESIADSVHSAGEETASASQGNRQQRKAQGGLLATEAASNKRSSKRSRDDADSDREGIRKRSRHDPSQPLGLGDGMSVSGQDEDFAMEVEDVAEAGSSMAQEGSPSSSL